jgi:hypothetical protein
MGTPFLALTVLRTPYRRLTQFLFIATKLLMANLPGFFSED